MRQCNVWIYLACGDFLQPRKTPRLASLQSNKALDAR